MLRQAGEGRRIGRQGHEAGEGWPRRVKMISWPSETSSIKVLRLSRAFLRFDVRMMELREVYNWNVHLYPDGVNLALEKGSRLRLTPPGIWGTIRQQHHPVASSNRGP